MVVDDTRHLVGQLVPAQEADVTFDRARFRSASNRPSSRFDLSGVETGRIRLQIQTADGRSITGWFEV